MMSATNSMRPESSRRLSDYNNDEDGPLFAVSDGGSAGMAAVDVAYSWTNAAALEHHSNDWLRLSVILDREQMTGPGGTPIDPHRPLQASAAGRRLLSTKIDGDEPICLLMTGKCIQERSAAVLASVSMPKD